MWSAWWVVQFAWPDAHTQISYTNNIILCSFTHTQAHDVISMVGRTVCVTSNTANQLHTLIKPYVDSADEGGAASLWYVCDLLVWACLYYEYVCIMNMSVQWTCLYNEHVFTMNMSVQWAVCTSVQWACVYVGTMSMCVRRYNEHSIWPLGPRLRLSIVCACTSSGVACEPCR
jgi:hypothetical protein